MNSTPPTFRLRSDVGLVEFTGRGTEHTPDYRPGVDSHPTVDSIMTAVPSKPANLARAELDAFGRELGLVVADVLRQTDKSLLVAGAVGDQPVVAKLLLDDDEFWRTKFDHEIGVYRAFVDHQPPIRVPSLIHTARGRLLVLERLAGRCLDAQRYPNHALSAADVDAALDAVTALHTWQPPADVFTPIFDYPERVDRYHGHGILTAADAEALRRLLDSWSGSWVAMVLTREIRTHRELPDGPLRHERLRLIETLWARARKRLHTLARSGRSHRAPGRRWAAC